MPKSHVLCTDHRAERADGAAARLRRLREAARVGFADLDAGRFRTVAPETVAATIAALAGRSRQEPTAACHAGGDPFAT